MRTHATNWLELAEKVEDYRRDVLPEADLVELQRRQEALKKLLRDKANASDLQVAIGNLESVLRKTGGTFYPKRSLVEYVEFFLVAAIVILGIRAYFVQPFKIPTNSMWPSYNGMTAEVYESPAEEPGTAMKALRFATQLAKPYRIDAPTSGEVSILLGPGGRHREVRGRKWLVIPTTLKEVEMRVGNTPVTFRVPADFDVDKLLSELFFPAEDGWPSRSDPRVQQVGARGWILHTGKRVQAGDRILSFDIQTGDQLFVDRISYHFVKPSVGDGFVFRTQALTRLHALMPQMPEDQYYIKRLVGLPGDELEIREPILYRNGKPIEGAEAFAANATRAGNYPGYRNIADMGPGDVVTVPEDHYFAVGDNSASSLDGRYWGAIPAKDVVGRPLFIYYPFTSHWGVAP